MNFLYELLDDFLSLLFPRLCKACSEHLMRNEDVICTECYISIPRTNFHLLPQNPVAQMFWGRCPIEKATSFSFYTRGSKMRQLIHNMKYKGHKEIGYELGKIFSSSLKGSGFSDDLDIIIPVPLHQSKLRKRGFNQSEFIARGIAEVTGLQIETGCLKREAGKATGTQTKSTRFDRWINVEGIFTVECQDILTGKHILLVDDVITTGSTIESCANELLKIENVKVSVVALAAVI
jgi:ComF family protein